MRIQLLVIGKTAEGYLREGIAVYEKRLRRYPYPFSLEVVPDVKFGGKMSEEVLKKHEAEALLGKINPEDTVILLDERGRQRSSPQLAEFIEEQVHRGTRRLVFVIGGAFGFGEAVYDRADGQLSLSKMTFTHQMIRLFIVEQLYRAMTILRNEGYHNE